MNEIIVKWNQIYAKGIALSTSTKASTLLFADDEVVIAHSEDGLERRVFALQNIKNFGMGISPEKSETMAFLEQDTVRCKIVVDYKCLQKLKNF
jgi:hypothetical protein